MLFSFNPVRYDWGLEIKCASILWSWSAGTYRQSGRASACGGEENRVQSTPPTWPTTSACCGWLRRSVRAYHSSRLWSTSWSTVITPEPSSVRNHFCFHLHVTSMHNSLADWVMDAWWDWGTFRGSDLASSNVLRKYTVRWRFIWAVKSQHFSMRGF